MIPIFLISDENYAKYTGVTIQSVISGTKEKLAFYILDGGITEDSKAKITSIVEKSRNSVEFIKMDFKLFEKFPNLAHFSLNSYFRYLIADLKPKIKKAVYIDTDIIICGDIAEIYNIDLKNVGLAATPYIEEDLKLNSFMKHKKNLGLTERHLYFNSGLLLINCDYWRKYNISKLLFETTKSLIDILQMPDQDVLNVVFAEKYLVLPKQYNLVIDLSVKFMNLNEFISNINSCFVLHYTGGNDVRPWIKKDVPCKQYFWNFAIKTPFYQDLKYELLLNQFKFINNRGKYSKKFLLLNFLPIMKMKEKNNIKKYYLFGFIPILKVKNK